MSSSHQSPQPPKKLASSLNQPDAQATPPELVPHTETSSMDDQLLASTLIMDSSAPSPPDELSSPTVDPSDITEIDDSSDSDAMMRQQPIPPASEPMQYRAIGLIRGKYTASEEQFTRGTLVTENGVAIDAVLLGRVMSLVKKHLDLEQSHLWVVYPRTRIKDNDLHAQIVGVWEPEKLNKGTELDSSDSASEDQPTVENEPTLSNELEEITSESHPLELQISELQPEPQTLEPQPEPQTLELQPKPQTLEPQPEPQEDYFSIRGEVLFYLPEEEKLVVKIQQSPRKGDEEGKSFKLNLKGSLDGKVVGYFWDLNVQRQDNSLVVQDGMMIALVPPKKRGKDKKSFRGGRPGGVRKRWDGPPRDGQRQPSGERRGGDRFGERSPDRSNVGAPPVRREALPKPIKKKNSASPE